MNCRDSGMERRYLKRAPFALATFLYANSVYEKPYFGPRNSRPNNTIGEMPSP